MSRFPEGYYGCRFSYDGGLPPQPFAIITAWNPMDEPWSHRMNRAADLRLQRLIDRKFLTRRRTECSASDGSHREAGWAIGCDRRLALAIGRRFKQRAVWWIESDQLQLVACKDGHAETVANWPPRR